MYKSNWRKRTTNFAKKTGRDKTFNKYTKDFVDACEDNNDTDIEYIRFIFDK